jgi:hypothetical protein
MPFLKRAARVLGQVVAPNPLARKAVDHFTRPVSTYWTPQAFNFLEKKGAGVIERILVCRTPVSGTIQRVLNLLSLGKFDEAKRDLVLDKLYHTFMRISYVLNGAHHQVVLEKNEKPYFTESRGRSQEENMVVPVTGLTIKDFVNDAIRKVGFNRYFVYDAFTNNCQRFVLDNLTSSPQVQVSPAVIAFVNQNAEQLLSRIPGYVQPISHLLTNTANRTESVLRGH